MTLDGQHFARPRIRGRNMKSHNAALLGFALASTSTIAVAQRVWVVAPLPSAGVDFTSIQSAVDAAADGDTVLVRQGNYDSIRIHGKGLIVSAEGYCSLRPTSGYAILVRDTAPSQRVVIRGDFSCDVSGGLWISRCLGPVLIEECSFYTYPSTSIRSGATVIESPVVTMVRCLLQGASRQGVVPGFGLHAIRSSVNLHECTLLGSDASFLVAADGGAGAHLDASFLSATSTTIQGGKGGYGAASGGVCTSVPGTGGPALQLGGPSAVYAFACTLVPGQGGSSAPSPCPVGSAGARVAGAGTLTEMVGVAPQLAATSHVHTGDTFDIEVSGPVGASAFLLMSPQHDSYFLPACRGTVDPELPTAFTFPVGVVPSSGRIELPITVVGNLGALSANVYVQAVMFHMNECLLGTTTALLVVDSRFCSGCQTLGLAERRGRWERP
jgi:hypothetical protein